MDYLGAFVAGYFLFVCWVVAIMFIGGAFWLVAGVAGWNRRTIAILVLPFLSGTMKLINKLSTPTLALFAVWAVLTSKGFSQPLPPPAAQASVYGEYGFCIAFALFVFVYIPRSYGMSIAESLQLVDTQRRHLLSAMRFFGLMSIGSLAAYVRGPYCAYIVVLLVALAVVIVYLTIDACGLQRFLHAPVVAAGEPAPGDEQGAPLFLQISDIHVTCQRNGIPTGGGRSGLEELTRVREAVVSGALPFPIVVVSGDLVDRGDQEEWQRAMPSLRELRASGVVVLLAPGNHDILPSYSPSRMLWSGIHPAGPVVDGEQLRRYFDAALELEPRLLAWDGVPLGKYLEAFDGPWRALQKNWDAARDEAVVALGLAPDTDHWKALGNYRRSNPTQSAALEQRFQADATALYPQIGADYWQHVLYHVSPKTVAPHFMHDPWQGKWYEPYPLCVAHRVLDAQVDVYVVNSTPSHPLLGESALGAAGETQLQRLDALIENSSAATVLVVHHHALARWESQDYEFQRWGVLAHDSTESRRLVDLLLARSSPERNIVVLSGHTHGPSRFGFLPAAENAANGIWIFESGALGEPGGSRMLGGHVGAAGRFRASFVQV